MLPDLEGARIEHLEQLESGSVVVVFGFKGTDDGSGYFLVSPGNIYVTDDDPDAWRALTP